MLNTTNGDAERFLFAGNATVTVSNPTGERYTFKVRGKAKQIGTRLDLDRGERVAINEMIYFASLLSGPNNDSDYRYVGIVDGPKLTITAKSQYSADSKPAKVIAWILRKAVERAPLPVGYELRHEGRCGRCGRKLTVPESIDAGIGPECASRM